MWTYPIIGECSFLRIERFGIHPKSAMGYFRITYGSQVMWEALAFLVNIEFTNWVINCHSELDSESISFSLVKMDSGSSPE